MGTLQKNATPSRRKSTPLTEQDLRDLEIIRLSPEYASRSEASVLQELMHRAIQAVKEEQMEAGYAEIARQEEATREERRAISRRRRPSWADEP